MGTISHLIGIPLGWIIWLIYQICHNYVISIIFFTLITKVLLFPISVKTQKSSAAMQALQPKLDKLKKQYGKNQEKLNEETMKLYNEEGVNPMGSCLPAFIQFPILYGILDVVYRPIYHVLRINSEVINAAKEIVLNQTAYGTERYFQSRPELYILQAIKNPEYRSLFSDPQFSELVDRVGKFSNTLFGADLSLTPTFKPEAWTAEAVILVLIPILSGVFQLIMSIYSTVRQKKTNPEAASQMAGMNAMFYIMPLFSVWFALNFPAAIGFYWMISSLFSLVQQVVLNKIYTPEYVATLIEKDKQKKKNSKRQSMMDRYQQLLAEQQAQQSGGRPANQPIRTTAAVSDDDDGGDAKEVKMSKSQQKEYERMLIREARRKQAEKYGEDFDESDDGEI